MIRVKYQICDDLGNQVTIDFFDHIIEFRTPKRGLCFYDDDGSGRII